MLCGAHAMPRRRHCGELARRPPLSTFLQFGPMPLFVSSLIAFSFFDRCASPMPRSTFGAFVNWILSYPTISMRLPHGSRKTVEIVVPRARVGTANGGTAEWKSRTLPRYARMTKQVEALIAGAYLAGTNTRRVRRALAALFRGAVGKDTVSRVWRKVKPDWEAWSKRPLGEEDIVRLILDGTVVRARLDKKATSLSLLVVLGVRRDGQKVLLAVKNMGGESEAAWRALLDDLVARGLKTPEFLII